MLKIPDTATMQKRNRTKHQCMRCVVCVSVNLFGCAINGSEPRPYTLQTVWRSLDSASKNRTSSNEVGCPHIPQVQCQTRYMGCTHTHRTWNMLKRLKYVDLLWHILYREFHAANWNMYTGTIPTYRAFNHGPCTILTLRWLEFGKLSE